ncbi:MAG: 2,3-bisphosphoglycerate-independent phosphoglycerate mutase [Gammaproteobacteria bacterium]|nr:2,3-bisphosphoglycerate-independent phosphoglycerate mutase [Gammaproteobacteria bacterium]MCP5199311.1 2,3-bisphosphoglycerate-independent phosphoglycerate mutase [Gammaproteobacteria bacterium]
MATVKHPVLLIILDGWGYSPESDHNAIVAARTPVWDGLMQDAPHTLIRCSGTDVGLPDRQMGNSEVGHMHIGAGRLIDQDFSRIGKAIASGEFAHNAVFVDACRAAASGGHAVHVMGLLSPGGVHSHEDHILALIDLAAANGVGEILVHAFLDGRDTPPKSAAASLQRLAAHCAATPGARIASVSGRYYAMDRNNNWDRVARAYAAIVEGHAAYSAADAGAALDAAYARGETDEFVEPTVITADGTRHRVADGDVVLFANFRADRARQITTAMTAADFDGFARTRAPALTAFVTMTDYGEQFDLPVAFPAFDLPHTFGAVVAEHGLRQLRIAETEKYAHVTFFFNGGEEQVFAGEDRVLVPSPAVATYDLAPEMSAPEVTARLVEAIASERYDAIVCNYANADMVGHTGVFDATVRCIEALDACLGRVLEAARAHGFDVLITADHGNAEQMYTAGAPHTAHTSNRVPLVYVGRAGRLAADGSLVDLAPTLLRLMGLEAPPEMTGRPLVALERSAQDAA